MFLNRGAIDIVGHLAALVVVVVLPETELIGCVDIHRYIYMYTERGLYKELAHAIMEAGKSQVLQVCWQAGDLERPMV